MIKTVGFLLFFYYVITFFLFGQTDAATQTSVLKDRLGTILWHAGQNNLSTQTESHVYCYYPFGSTQYENRGGENFIKQESTIYDCNGWFGIVITNGQDISSL
ncbi:hypothetical protein HY385_00595 [Candidatus Daviesbacteria bacterium]|nr:hypothetical protein [Candidatus Daviesbacteria bacterium]